LNHRDDCFVSAAIKLTIWLMKTIFTLLLGGILLLCPFKISFPQAAQHIDELLQLSEELSFRFQIKKAEALRKAAQLGIPTRADADAAQGWDLMWFENGRPVYFNTDNAEGAQLIRADRVYPGGVAGLNLTGAGRTLGIWDWGRVSETHQEFGTRVVQQDGAPTPNNHASHVAGTMVAAGIEPDARGLSYEANLNAWDYDDDISEMAVAGAAGLNISQHAYSRATGWLYGNQSGFDAWHWHGDPTISETEDYGFGFYGELTQQWDQVAHLAPNYLIVKSAGNTRGLGPESGTGHYVFQGGQWTWSTTVRPVDGGDDGYDCISWRGNAKNILTVGALTAQGQMSNFSSWGPTDDGRIKPDLVAKGVDVYSAGAGSDVDYYSNTGTSMASAMVSGAVGLLLQHQENLNPGVVLRSATMKGLLIHSADDLISGAPGPDYRYGWGLVDIESAANIMSNNSATAGLHIYEQTITDQQQISIQVQASGDAPLRATIAWTEVPGTPPSPSLNPTDLMLVNDLDMRITDPSNNVFFPYILNPADPGQPASTGDNFRDNVEMVHIPNPQEGAIYTVTITHKGTLAGGNQDFSLIITGNQNISNVSNPQVFSATPAGINQINLEWTKNVNDDDVMLVWSATDLFGIPQDGAVYSAGQQIPGGGTVLYRGSATAFQHTALPPNTTYYYRAFSSNNDDEYSSGISANATTDCDVVAILPFSENFDTSAALPGCWEITDNLGNGQVWQIGTHGEGLQGTTGNYAFLNSDAYGEGNSQNSDLITPILDLTAYSDVQLSFTHYFRQYGNVSTGSLYYSTNGGQSWTLIQQWNQTTLNPASFQQTIPEVAGQPNVRYRWNYTGTWGFYWDIDDVLITGTFNAITTTWTGAEDNNWHNPNNWDVMVPAVYTDVIIPAGLTNYPTITSYAVCRNLTLGSSPSGTATLLGEQNLMVDQTTTVERHIPAADWQSGSDGWHFLSSPVQGQVISPAFTTTGVNNDYDFYAWDEENVAAAWLNHKVPGNNITHFKNGQGYLVAYEQADTKTFSGNLNSGSIQVDISHTPGSNWSGWNFLGNPYPSAINWQLADKSIFQDNFAYVYNTNKPGGAGYVSIEDVIPAHQGFFVRSNQAGTFLFTENLRAHGGAWMKAGNNDKLVLRLANDHYYDETTIRTREGSSFERDRQDALKMFSFNHQIPQLYTLTDDQVKLDINSIPASGGSSTIPVSMLVSGHETSMSLSISEVNGIFESMPIFLKDQKENVLHDLSKIPLYTFDGSEHDHPDRFLLLFEMVGIQIIDDDDPIEIRVFDRILIMSGKKPLEGKLRLFDMAGRLITERVVKMDEPVALGSDLATGWYVVQFVSNETSISRKILLD
jgi:hypothetical protein